MGGIWPEKCKHDQIQDGHYRPLLTSIIMCFICQTVLDG